MADSEEEFAELIQPITQEVVDGYCLYRTVFADATMSGLTDMLGPVYPKDLAWYVRSYQVNTKDYKMVDWEKLRIAFQIKDPMPELTLTSEGKNPK